MSYDANIDINNNEYDIASEFFDRPILTQRTSNVLDWLMLMKHQPVFPENQNMIESSTQDHIFLGY